MRWQRGPEVSGASRLPPTVRGIAICLKHELVLPRQWFRTKLFVTTPHSRPTGRPVMPRRSSTLQDEIKQTRPFRSSAEEVVVSVLRTAAVMQRHLAQVVEAHGVTIQQYNVLRILRGAGDAGLPTLAIRDRMVEEAAGITRLLDKLETAGHVIRERSTPDRRQVLCHITQKGINLITELDGPMDAANQRAGSMLDDAERGQLVELLGAIRAAFANHRATERAGVRPSERTQGSMRSAQPPM
jgi:MarR family transcriptional regulator, organic hydroperoxide resistance regulator